VEPFTFFISYRRQDTAPIALLLKYEIERRLQFVRVVVDVDDIHHGDAFPARIKELIDKAHATIVLIGKNWMPRATDAAPDAPRASPAKNDWIVTELLHSTTSPINCGKESRYGLEKRILLPIFVDCGRRFDQFELPEAIAHVAHTHAESIDYAGWPGSIGPLIERIAIKLDLKKRPDTDEYPRPDGAKARTQSLPDQELASILQYEDYEGWYLDNFGNAEVRYIVKTFKFQDFDQAADFMALVANHCRVLGHHPEWRNVFNHVTVSLTTWDARRRVTIYDLNLALFMNKAARSVCRR
jgi:4a-hydroxytetrahydrobiopterin dehydratase